MVGTERAGSWAIQPVAHRATLNRPTTTTQPETRPAHTPASVPVPLAPLDRA